MLKAIVKFTAVLGCAFALAVPASAADAYYQDKTVTLVVGFSPGGGTDLFGRAFAEHLGKHIDGSPAVIVQNMPGAGGVLASNYFSSQAPKDGSVIMVGTGQLLMRMLLELDGSRAKIDELEPIVAGPMGRITYASSEFGTTDRLQILKSEEELVLGVPEVISTIDAVLGLEVLGSKFRPIVGYEGKSDTRLALERGEINVDEQTTPLYQTSVSPLVAEGKAVPLFSQGLMDGDKLVRDPAAPDLPTVADVYRELHGSEPTGEAWEAYKASIRAIGNGGKILMMHREAPPEAREAIHAAIADLVKDQAFLEASKNLLEGYGFNTGDQLAKSVAAVAQTDPKTLDWLKNLLSTKYDMSFN